MHSQLFDNILHFRKVL